MKLKEYLDLYKTEYVIDKETGKKHRVSTYIGKYYTIETEKLKSARLTALIGLVAAWISFLACGLTNSHTSQWTFSQVAFMLTLLPLFYETASVIKLLRIKGAFTEDTKRDTLSSGMNAAIFLAICGLLWAACSVIFLIRFGIGDSPFLEILFLTGGIVEIAGGLAIYFAIDKTNDTVKEKADK